MEHNAFLEALFEGKLDENYMLYDHVIITRTGARSLSRKYQKRQDLAQKR